MRQQSYPILIIGGGIVGRLLAAACTTHQLPFVLIDQRAEQTTLSSPPKSFVISYSNSQWLRSINCWPDHTAKPFYQVEISRVGCLIRQRLRSDYDLPLGYVVAEDKLWHHVNQTKAFDCNQFFSEIQIDQVIHRENQITVMAGQKSWTGCLLFGCDGKQSFIRQSQGLTWIESKNYLIRSGLLHGQHHIKSPILRFSHSDTYAIIPIDSQQIKFIQTAPLDQNDLITSTFTNLDTSIGYPIAKLQPKADPETFVFQSGYATSGLSNRVLLMGQALQALAPIGGRGLNAAIEDCRLAVTQLMYLLANDKDIGLTGHWLAFEQQRQARHWQDRLLINRGVTAMRFAPLAQCYFYSQQLWQRPLKNWGES